MKYMPKRGSYIITTDKHSHKNEGILIGIVEAVIGGIIVINTSDGETDKILWRSYDGAYNTFYCVSGGDVMVNTGKYKGSKGYFVCWTEKHRLSSHRRAQIKLQTGIGWTTLLVNENNFKFIGLKY